MDAISERDWKVFRALHAIALERCCARVVDELGTALGARGRSAHERYLSVHEILYRRDAEIARAFDDLRRSSAHLQLQVILTLDVLRPEDLAPFSSEMRASIQRARAAGEHRGSR